MNCGVGRRCSSDLALLWLWRRLAAAAPIQPLAWEPPYAASAPLESKTDKKQNKTNKNKNKNKKPTVKFVNLQNKTLIKLMYHESVYQKSL